ncbi:MAG: ThiF family adenylyltransferase [Ignavibacteriales bacterium]|nr:ThiF family adenylyltransferase [Ignavibacteriales bacterium]
MNENQKLALEQLKAIEIEDRGNFKIIDYYQHGSNDDYLCVNISILTRLYNKSIVGFNFRPRERFKLLIPKDFPYEIPNILFSDFRYYGKPHVQWGSFLCLYQAPDVEWDPAEGMFGYISRLDLYLKRAAINQLDPNDAPLHPPVAYTSSNISYKIIPNKNSPSFNDDYWLGAAKLERLNDDCLFISDWYGTDLLNSKSRYAAVILLKKDMPFEYPYFLFTLIHLLKDRGIDLVRFVKHLQKVMAFNKSGTPLFIIIGTPMRGDSDNRKQHLLCWYLETKIAGNLRGFDSNKFRQNPSKAENHLNQFIKYAEKSKLLWCSILENRPEIIIPRDRDAYTSFFTNKTIEIWGCGAVGSHIAEIIIRAKPKRLLLFDNNIVKPGLLSRQLFYEDDIGLNKAEAMKNRIGKIHSLLNDVKVESFNENILKRMDKNHWSENSDIIIDTTASKKVLRKLDGLLIKENIQKEIISFVVDSIAKKGMVVYRSKKSYCGIVDLIRKSKLHLCDSDDNNWLPYFYPDNGSIPQKLFQPEPGCSDPTFSGSEADISTISGLMMNSISRHLVVTNSASKCIFLSQNIYNYDEEKYHEITFDNYSDDLLLKDPVNNYKVILNKQAIENINKIIKKENSSRNTHFETGGLIFGEWDDLNKVVYIDDISEPPKDSIAAANDFVCGILGTKELNDERKKKYSGSSYFVGLWHSHPFGSPNYSGKDKHSMELVVTELCPPKSLLLIIAYTKKEQNIMGFVFDKTQFAK